MASNLFPIDEKIENIVEYIKKNEFLIAEKELSKLLEEKEYKSQPIIYNLLGFIFQRQGNVFLSEKNFETAISLDKNFHPALYNLGVLHYKNLSYDKAIIFLNKVIKINPSHYDSFFLIAQAYLGKRNFDKAILNYQNCIKLSPNQIDAYLNLANLYCSIHQITDAKNLLKEAKEIFNGDIRLLNNLGLVHKKLHELDEAIELFVEANKIKYDEIEPLLNLGLSYLEKKNYVRSLEFIEKALNLKQSAELYFNKSLVLEKLERLDEAFECLEKSIELDSNFSSAHQRKIEISIKLLDHKKAKQLFSQLDLNNLSEENLGLLIFYVNYLYDLKKNDYFKLLDLKKKKILKRNNYFIKKFESQKKNTSIIDRNLHKIKIGFISADFNKHPVMYQLFDFFTELAKSNDVEVYIYDNSEALKSDEITTELKKHLKNWINIHTLSDFDVAKRVNNDGVKILFDLSGHTEGNRLGVFSFKPCNFQASWIGYLNSIGTEGVDYLIADQFVIPENSEYDLFYKEKIIRLENCWSILSKLQENILPNYTKLPCKENNFFTFGSLNNYFKYNERVLDLWSDILRLTNKTKLFLSGNAIFLNQVFQDKFFTIFDKKKIDRSRIIFNGLLDKEKSLEKYNNIDICLDPFPYNGGTTMLESAFMCVPSLALEGQVFISRCGFSINKNLKLDEWNCKTESEYLDKAVKFSQEFDFILQSKKKIYKGIYLDGLFSSEKLVRNFLLMVKNLIRTS